MSFITDTDTISFATQFGKVYNFIILLNGKDSCFTPISANYNGVLNPQRINKAATALADTIPFNIKGSRIYFNGKINGHKNLSIMFDLGTGGSCVNVNSVKKAWVKFDSKVMVENSDDLNEEPRSRNNTLELVGLKWGRMPLVQVKNMDWEDDLIIGNSLFGDKVIEIDYDRKIFIVNHQLNNDLKPYTRHEVIFEQHRPKIQTAFTVNGKKYTD